MDHYFLTARSVTYAQQMTRLLERSGIFVKVRRVTPDMGLRGCGYTLEVGQQRFKDALDVLRRGGKPPIRIFYDAGDGLRELRDIPGGGR